MTAELNTETQSSTETPNNVDAQEIKKFSSIADKWWDLQGEFKPLHELNPLRLQFINERAPVSGKRVLDIGCGGGILAEGLAKMGAQVTGIDMAEESLDVATQHANDSALDIHYQKIPTEAFAETHQEQFDIVTCMEMLEHVPDPTSIVHACQQLLKPGGQVFFSTINRNPKSYLFAILGAEYVLNIIPRGTHDYMRFIKPSELAAWTRAAGLKVQDIAGMSYNPLTHRYKLNRDVAVNYFMHAQKAS